MRLQSRSDIRAVRAQEQLSAAEEEHAALQASLQQLQDAQAAAEQGLADAEARKADAEQRQAQAEQDARAEARDLKALGPKVRQGEVTVREALKTVNAVVHDLGGRDRVDTMLQQLEFGPLSEREWRATQQEFETWTPAKGEEVLVRAWPHLAVLCVAALCSAMRCFAMRCPAGGPHTWCGSPARHADASNLMSSRFYLCTDVAPPGPEACSLRRSCR